MSTPMKRSTEVTNAVLNIHDGWCSLSATVINDPSDRFPEGDNILTTMVQDIDLVERIMETQNTIYHIWGDIHTNNQNGNF